LDVSARPPFLDKAGAIQAFFHGWGTLSLSLSTALNGFAEDQRQCCISATVSTVELAMVCCVEGLDVATLKAIYKDLLMTSELS